MLKEGFQALSIASDDDGHDVPGLMILTCFLTSNKGIATRNKGLTTRNKKLLGAKGIATRNKGLTTSS